MYGSDGDCDDGGDGAEYSICPLGSDCRDCGARAVVGVCGGNCTFGSDGDCDDGGDGAEYAACDIGTDCFDCGPRRMPFSPPPSSPFHPHTPPSLPVPFNKTASFVDTPSGTGVAVGDASSASQLPVVLGVSVGVACLIGSWLLVRRKVFRSRKGLLASSIKSATGRTQAQPASRPKGFGSFASASHVAHVEMIDVTPDKSSLDASVV